MATITFKGSEIKTSGNLPAKGSIAPDFKLVKADLSDVNLPSFNGKKKLLNIFPSIDTGVCAASVRKFNVEAAGLQNVVVLCISRDLPFAQNRFCSVEGIEKVVSLSEMRNSNFGTAYGLVITDGPLAGLFSRAVIVLDEQNKVIYTEQVPEIGQEPNYEEALKYLR